MKAVILAAGEGVRMRPLTLDTPKPLLPLAGKPLLQHLVEMLPPSVDELILVVGYRGEQIKDYCGTAFLGHPITYVTQTERKGTYHALELCKPYLAPDKPFAFFFSDDLLDPAAIAECLSYPCAVVASRVERPERFGVIELNPDGTIRDIVEKPEHPLTDLATTTAFSITPHIFRYPPAPHPRTGEYYFSTALSAMAKEHPIRVVKTKFWFPIGTPEDMVLAETILKDQASRS